MTIPQAEHIEVTDPAHPFYGLRFPCLGVTTKQRLGRVCVIWLAPGIERLVPVAATNLAPAPPLPLSAQKPWDDYGVGGSIPAAVRKVGEPEPRR